MGNYRIHTDALSVLGSTHFVCEDYVVHGGETHPYVILADGCSSSKDTDIGARILVKVAERCFGKLAQDGMHIFDDEGFVFNQMFSVIITEANTIARVMGLDSSCLDATLIIAMVMDNAIRVLMLGDGFVGSVMTDGVNGVQVYRQSYSMNAPYYLSYQLDYNKREAYKRIEQVLRCEKIKLGSGLIVDDTCYSPSDYLYHNYYFPLDSTKIVAVTTDGLESFQYGSEKAPYQER